MEASHVGGFDDIGISDKFGEISSNCQMNANKLNTWRPAMLGDNIIHTHQTQPKKPMQTLPKNYACTVMIRFSAWGAYLFFGTSREGAYA